VEEVVTGQFATGLVQQALKSNAVLGEAPLQGPSAEVQFSCEILYPRTLTGEQLLQNAFGLFAKILLRELLRELRLKLRRDSREQVSVVSNKGESTSDLLNMSAFWLALNFTGQWKCASYISRYAGAR
jgi:hypothetical protein